ncbi:MAG: peptidoglycan-binding protein [Ilumatobacteraceae bacterium]
MPGRSYGQGHDHRKIRAARRRRRARRHLDRRVQRRHRRERSELAARAAGKHGRQRDDGAAPAHRAGYSTGADGIFGSGTKSRVVSFQRSRGLAADGVVGQNTWGKLISNVQYGGRGSTVRAAQVQLNKYGHRLSVDGIFGSGTRSATIAFQRSRGISADGIVGPTTWLYLTSGASGGGGGGGGSRSLPVPRSALPRSEYDDPHHDYPALDLPVGTGTSAYAVVGGTATPISSSSCGLGMSLAGSDGGSYTYCHFSSQGLHVGEVGERGNPHRLHGQHRQLHGPAPAPADQGRRRAALPRPHDARHLRRNCRAEPGIAADVGLLVLIR